MGKPCGYSGCVYPIFSNGFCKFHQWKRTDKKYTESKKSFATKHIEKMKAKNKENGVVDKSEKSELDKWFDRVIDEFVKPFPFCHNCGEPISERYYRHAVAHIFPKAIFESVSTFPFNFVIAGSECGCHNETHRLDLFSKMRVFTEAVERFKMFEPLIKEKHKYLDEFKKYAEK